MFVPVHGPQVEIAGAVVRPARYELPPGETLRELIALAGGFDPTALRRRVQIERILPPAERGLGGRDRVLIDLGESELADSLAPGFPLMAGDRVKVFTIAERRRNFGDGARATSGSKARSATRPACASARPFAWRAVPSRTSTSAGF